MNLSSSELLYTGCRLGEIGLYSIRGKAIRCQQNGDAAQPGEGPGQGSDVHLVEARDTLRTGVQHRHVVSSQRRSHGGGASDSASVNGQEQLIGRRAE